MNQSLNIAILGTRGIPNTYGGFEQFAEYLSVGLVKKGHHVTVYNPNFHDYEGNNYKGVSIKKIFSPESYIGGAANYIYDYNCLRHALKQNFDIILECGHGCAVFYYILPIKRSKIFTNMDGLEWKRSKWGFLVRKLAKLNEKLAVKKSDYLVADNEGIRQYYIVEYDKNATTIPYGAVVFDSPQFKSLNKYGIEKRNYFLLIARLEPENSIEIILDGYDKSQSNCPLLVVGDDSHKYGGYLKNHFSKNENIKFLGGIYNDEIINNLRYYSRAYFHGHTVGGTNPSLLEAMACQALIIAHDNQFNRSVLNEHGTYFTYVNDVQNIINNIHKVEENKSKFIKNNLLKIRNKYNWDKIVKEYETLFMDSLKKTT